MNVKIRVKINEKKDSNVKAYVGLTFDECFVVTGLKVVDGKNGLFVAYPSYKSSDGTYKNIAYPWDKEYREILTQGIIGKYKKEIGNHKETYSNHISWIKVE